MLNKLPTILFVLLSALFLSAPVILAQGTGSVKIHQGTEGAIIEHYKIEAQTSFPVNLDEETNQITLTLPNGEQQELTFLPQQVVSNLITFGIMEEEEEAKTFQIKEEKGRIVYKITGVDRGKLFWLIPINTPFEAIVDAQTGEIDRIHVPFLYRLIDNWVFG